MTEKGNTTISLCAGKVLDHVGASEQIRRNHVEKGLIDEVVINTTLPSLLGLHDDLRLHNFGSWCEGTTTKGLASDIDRVIYDVNYPAVEHIPNGLEQGHLIVNDGTTKPGYVKLQRIINEGLPSTSNIDALIMDTDQFGRMCLRNNSPFLRFMNIFPGQNEERRGPAVTCFGHPNVRDSDYVYAIRCYSVPSFTREWIHRPRAHSWPPEQLLANMSKDGCLLVGKGHPSSQISHLEWRISFSFQERELMFSLNSTQHKCYILLKMIKQYLRSGVNIESVSSYHLKTALFYTIENNPTHIWIPGNLIYCTELCLKQLLDWLKNENCPNFFVPEENMFDRLSSDVMKMTAKFVREMLESDKQYLILLTCDKFGELLQKSLAGEVLPDSSSVAIEFDVSSKYYLSLFSIFFVNKLVILENSTCASETLNALKLLFDRIEKAGEILTSDRVFRKIEKGLSLILPHIHSQMAQTIAAIMLTVTDADKKRELMQDFDHHVEQAKESNCLSLKLITANLFFNENMFKKCEEILDDCETLLKDNTLPACACTIGPDYDLTKLVEKDNTAAISPLDFHDTCVTPCLIFLPSQAGLAPTPLLYEIYRSVGAATDNMSLIWHYWYGVIAIDTELYLFFLQYLVYSKLEKYKLVEEVKNKIIRLLDERLSDKRIVGHVETGFNLLGWICKQEGDFKMAANYFWTSWQIRPDHNAAKWHALLMMYEQYTRERKGEHFVK